jgi:hypothetical protein
MCPKIDVMERECKNYNICNASKRGPDLTRGHFSRASTTVRLCVPVTGRNPLLHGYGEKVELLASDEYRHGETSANPQQARPCLSRTSLAINGGVAVPTCTELEIQKTAGARTCVRPRHPLYIPLARAHGRRTGARDRPS